MLRTLVDVFAELATPNFCSVTSCARERKEEVPEALGIVTLALKELTRKRATRLSSRIGLVVELWDIHQSLRLAAGLSDSCHLQWPAVAECDLMPQAS